MPSELCRQALSHECNCRPTDRRTEYYDCPDRASIAASCGKNESKQSEMGPVRQNPIQTARSVHNFICVCTALCTTVAHNIAQNRPDNFPSYHPDNHHCSDDVYLREGGSKGHTDERGETVILTSTPAQLTSPR